MDDCFGRCSKAPFSVCWNPYLELHWRHLYAHDRLKFNFVAQCSFFSSAPSLSPPRLYGDDPTKDQLALKMRPKACVRCRARKLKACNIKNRCCSGHWDHFQCNKERPCIACTRAHVECRSQQYDYRLRQPLPILPRKGDGTLVMLAGSNTVDTGKIVASADFQPIQTDQSPTTANRLRHKTHKRPIHQSDLRQPWFWPRWTLVCMAPNVPLHDIWCIPSGKVDKQLLRFGQLVHAYQWNYRTIDEAYNCRPSMKTITAVS